ncbi:MFS transporter [Micromonospora sp. DT201]|uniref:MFS transporter n=1 Tax=Micromonospora sp. DT201 TaxID=3393442 RepID=UPI003CED96D2
MSAVPANAVPAALVRRAGSAFAALAAVQVALIASITMLTVALPQLQRQWALSSPALVVVSTSYSVAFGALLLVAGNVADRFGHRRTLLGALAVFAVASVAAAGANGVTMLVAARFAQGVGAAFAVPAAMALIPIVFAGERQRARATALWGGLAATGASVGMVLSGPVVEVSWRWLFAPPGLIAVVAAVMVGRLVPGGLARRPARIDPLCTVLVVAGLTALIYGLGAESVLLAATGCGVVDRLRCHTASLNRTVAPKGHPADGVGAGSDPGRWRRVGLAVLPVDPATGRYRPHSGGDLGGVHSARAGGPDRWAGRRAAAPPFAGPHGAGSRTCRRRSRNAAAQSRRSPLRDPTAGAADGTPRHRDRTVGGNGGRDGWC